MPNPRRKHFRMDAPGNLLLMGEYAVTEPGGMGLCLAPELRAVLICRPQTEPDAPFHFVGIWPGSGLEWTAPSGEALAILSQFIQTPSLLAAIFADPQLANHYASQLAGLEIELDSSAFFDVQGRKRGFGSSAAACLLLCAAFMRILELPETDLPQLAINCHRRFQGGKGSGYDILCSYHGGLGIFTGGMQPQFRSAPGHVADSLRSFCLVEGPAPVRTGSSIERWQTWRSQDPSAAQTYMAGCANRIDRLENDPFTHPFAILREAALSGIEVGEALGISAHINFPPGVRRGNLSAKAVGAGNETGVVFGHHNDLPLGVPGQTIFHIAGSGLRSETILAEGRGHGKLLLWGEHAALWGWPAVGLSLPQYCTVRLIQGESATADELANEPQLRRQIQDLLERGRLALQMPPLPAGHLEISANVSRIGGYGSSAALCVALSQVLAQLSGKIFSPAQLWQLSNWLDCSFHGRASGIDSGLALSQGLQVFHQLPPDEGSNKSQEPFSAALPSLTLSRQALLRPLGSPAFWIVHAGITRVGNTKSLVAAVSQRLADGDQSTKKSIDLLGQLSQEAITALQSGIDVHVLGSLANQAQIILRDLGLSTPALDRILEVGLNAGAVGGKLSGAGGGGAFFLMCVDEISTTAVASALMAAAKDCQPMVLPMQETP